jgi:hypothetical protein
MRAKRDPRRRLEFEEGDLERVLGQPLPLGLTCASVVDVVSMVCRCGCARAPKSRLPVVELLDRLSPGLLLLVACKPLLPEDTGPGDVGSTIVFVF